MADVRDNALDEIAVELADRLRALSAHRPELASQLLWLLAEGRPVSPEQVAEALCVSRGEAIDILRASPGVELDDEDNVIGCFGLSLTPTPHHFRIGDHELFTWCALDALFLPIALNRSARVESSCPVTGDRIRVAVSPEALQRVEPAGAVMAIMVPEASEVCRDVRGAFCDKVHFFSSSETASVWVTGHKGATILTLADAYTLGHLLLKNLF
jgi:alkylmercury lyase